MRDLPVGSSRFPRFSFRVPSLRPPRHDLRTLPVSTLKIDRSFVLGLDDDDSARIVIEAMIALGMKLGYEVVAEGVETDAQAARLLEMGCRLGQGYLVAPPMPADLFRRRFLEVDS